jgi:DNA topoisomerase-6 subunit B
MVHMASVWVPFTSESKEAVAGYPEIQKEIRLALQAVGRKLGMYLRKRLKVRNEGERRNIFLRYLGEVATAVSDINRTDREKLYEQLLLVAKKKTAEADVVLGEDGKPLEEPSEEDFGGSVLIIDQQTGTAVEPPPSADTEPTEKSKATSKRKKAKK